MFRKNKMGLPPDTASLIMLEIGKELRFYEDSLALIGIIYIGKLTTSFSLSLYRGFKEHIFTKLYPNKEVITSFGNWARKYTYICSKNLYICIYFIFITLNKLKFYYFQLLLVLPKELVKPSLKNWLNAD